MVIEATLEAQEVTEEVVGVETEAILGGTEVPEVALEVKEVLEETGVAEDVVEVAITETEIVTVNLTIHQGIKKTTTTLVIMKEVGIALALMIRAHLHGVTQVLGGTTLMLNQALGVTLSLKTGITIASLMEDGRVITILDLTLTLKRVAGTINHLDGVITLITHGETTLNQVGATTNLSLIGTTLNQVGVKMTLTLRSLIGKTETVIIARVTNLIMVDGAMVVDLALTGIRSQNKVIHGMIKVRVSLDF